MRVAANAKLTRSLSQKPKANPVSWMSRHRLSCSRPFIIRHPVGPVAMAQQKGSEIEEPKTSPITPPPRDMHSCSAADYLSALPDETLLRIFGYLPLASTGGKNLILAKCLVGIGDLPRPPVRDYAALALTCRSLNRAATTMLYER